MINSNFCIFLILLISNISYGKDEKCHLGKEDIGSLKSCNVDIYIYGDRQSFGGKSNKKTKERHGIREYNSLYYCNHLDDEDKFKKVFKDFSFYSFGGKLTLKSAKVEVRPCDLDYPKRGKDAVLEFRESTIEPKIGVSRDLPLKNFTRMDYRELQQTKNIHDKALGPDGYWETWSPGLLFYTLTGDENKKHRDSIEKWGRGELATFQKKSPGSRHFPYKVELFQRVWKAKNNKIQRAKLGGFVFVRVITTDESMNQGNPLNFVFDKESNLVVALTTYKQGDDLYFKPFVSFELYGIKYYLFTKYGSGSTHQQLAFYYVGSKGYVVNIPEPRLPVLE